MVLASVSQAGPATGTDIAQKAQLIQRADIPDCSRAAGRFI